MAAETLGGEAGLTRPLTTGVQRESDDVSKESQFEATPPQLNNQESRAAFKPGQNVAQWFLEWKRLCAKHPVA